ncbi:LytR/AlgR family response regulator transcription factor [Candidatus Formimonas warabiya]|uniref:Stage 0 sporulation protein A homolog n=1 Tax=Formimonas warabiya TaxID=1761012 RepID=A0A3G1KWZ9_FORW1|nr:LytTR family DNA-binding domain-containing protein [Candidatus Formimonas warabiya]ATW27018.1 DNA-binding response regulator [Candidatus Formimonas warabiya]
MILKTLIVDDEYPARQELRYLLEQFPDIEVVGEAAGATEALKLIQALEYDILFLDINLPGINGLELAASLLKLPRSPQVIFITAYDNYAVDAFDVNAVDYIMKPIAKQRLKKAIDKVHGKLKKEEEEPERKDPSGDKGNPESYAISGERGELMSSRIIAESGEKAILVDVKDIYFAYTEGEKVFVKTFGERMHTRFTLKELEIKLGKKNFFRAHRSFIVNLDKVKEILPFFKGTCLLVLEDKERSEIPVSRNQAKILRKILGY